MLCGGYTTSPTQPARSCTTVISLVRISIYSSKSPELLFGGRENFGLVRSGVTLASLDHFGHSRGHDQQSGAVSSASLVMHPSRSDPL
jgi:hypothetical protein